ncbi:MAG: LTA synthase family protein [Bacteroidales bacterium]|nr:LTA synthase family protein [Bacteroidales bacterium]
MSTDVWVLMPQFFVDFWYLFLILTLLIFIFIKFYSSLLINLINSEFPKSFFLKFLSLIIWLAVSLFFMRGGAQLRPINIASASQYTCSKYIPLVINTPFNIIKTINKDKIKVSNYFSSIQEVEKIYKPLHCYYKRENAFRNKNIVVFILESFSKEYIGALNLNAADENYKGYTPFLDSIIGHSIVFDNAYANGKRSIDATLSILAGVPNLMNTAYILSDYSANGINSIAGLLAPMNYTSWFFHGGTNGTMGFDNFVRLAEFDHYFGRNEYNNENDFDGKWGIYDEPFFQQMAKELDVSPKPFVSVMFTLSSHHPYTIPEKYINVFPKGNLDIHESIGYTDNALKLFFETSSKMDWFENTIFVFTADHTSESYYSEYNTKRGQYAVPLFFYIPDNQTPIRSSQIAQHTDILPTLMDLLNYEGRFIAFGNSLLDTNYDGISVNFANGLYQMIYNNYLMSFDGRNFIEAYDLNNDNLLENNIINSLNADSILKFESLFKAYIQSYQYRMSMNMLSVNKNG